MRCYGITNTSPDDVLHFLKTKAGIDQVAVVPVGGALPKKAAALFLLSIRDFNANASALNVSRYENTDVFVFASPLRISEISNCTPLDFDYKPGTCRSGFVYKKISLAAFRSKKPAPARRKTGEYLFQLIERTTDGSLLTPLMTFIYTLNASSAQTPVKELVAQHLVKPSQTPLKVVLEKASKYMTPAKAARLKEILSLDAVAKFHSAFLEYGRAATPNVKSICKKAEISDYEFRYLLSVYNTLKEFRPVRSKTIQQVTTEDIRPATKRNKAKADAKASEEAPKQITPKTKKTKESKPTPEPKPESARKLRRLS